MTYYTYSMISKNIYAEIFFQINCLYFMSFVVIRVFSKIRILPQILSCAEMQFLEIRSKANNHHISEAGVSFEIQFGLWIKIWAGEHIFIIWRETCPVDRFVRCRLRYDRFALQ